MSQGPSGLCRHVWETKCRTCGTDLKDWPELGLSLTRTDSASGESAATERCKTCGKEKKVGCMYVCPNDNGGEHLPCQFSRDEIREQRETAQQSSSPRSLMTDEEVMLRQQLRLQDADILAAAVDHAIRQGVLDARSEIADCRLDYGLPFSPEDMERYLARRRYGRNRGTDSTTRDE